ncbi:GNAT family N-acetyltransferase [Micromonospora zhanjiangensis]|uniref:GNAT family N-acetyltransferase n=1 Tax=Micromonospora zhanjiangensis TaxID=1522057 RepID=A0ABV8KSS8_9ACTN
MPAPVSLQPIGDDQRPVLESLWQLYRHDLSEFRGYLPDQHGRYGPGGLPRYFTDPGRSGDLIRVGADPAGFALLCTLPDGTRMVGEFFVVRAARRQRVGYAAARQLLDRHPGPWAIPFQEENPGAARFWRRVVGEVAGTAYREERRPVPGKPEIPPDVWLFLTA